MKFSLYQLALFDFVENKKGSLIVDAKAGSGKTTSIVEACNRLSNHDSVLFLAFSKAIVTELETRLPPDVKCSTFNSCGWASWRKHVKSYSLKIDAKKTWRIIWDMMDRKMQSKYGSFCNKMVGLAKSVGLTPDDSDEMWFEVHDHHDLTIDSRGTHAEGVSLAKEVLRRSIELSKTVCDFNDQLYMPWLRGTSFKKYKVIFVDEGQDVNPVQIELVKRMLAPGGRVIVVGDPFQAIYGFRGADHMAMKNLSSMFKAETLPLSISYRCSRAVIKEAQKYVSGIEVFGKAPQGCVETLSAYDISMFTNEDAILCRNNAPLIGIAYQIIERGSSVNFLGKDIAGGIKSLIKELATSTISIDNLIYELLTWRGVQTKKLEIKKQKDKIGSVKDRVECVIKFIDHLTPDRRTVPGLIKTIDDFFKSNNSGVTLSSVHKSKGKEWNHVFILGFDRYMPSKYASKPWQFIQENNLIYVAITRAKLNLSYIQEDSWSYSEKRTKKTTTTRKRKNPSKSRDTQPRAVKKKLTRRNAKSSVKGRRLVTSLNGKLDEDWGDPFE